MLFHSEKTYINKSKKRRNSSEPIIPRLHTSLKKIYKTNCERAALCISQKTKKTCQASLTVEAAVILPLFLIAMLTLVCVIDICRIHIEQQTAIAEQAKKLSTYAYAAGEYMEESYIDLYQVYPCRLPVSLIPGYQIDLALRGRVHAWTGRSEAECAADRESTAEEMVYVTENQDVYHTNSGCTYLELSIYAVGKNDLSGARNEDGGRYHPCEKCCGTSDVNTYYITSNGQSYHASRSCSGLTRRVRMIRKTEAVHLPVCSRCQGGG